MPALLRYFSDLIHFKTSKLNPIPLHGNPVLDNFVFKHAAVQTGRTFASAHSCGLRPIPVQQTRQRVSLPQRIRAGCDEGSYGNGKSLSSLPQRIRAGCDQAFHPLRRAVLPLPQRIRAGCDATMITATNQFHLCHSAFARVATAGHQRTCGHGLFKVVNNGTRNEGISALAGMEHFASAHSRGLRLGLAVKLPCRYWLCLSAFARVATLRPFSAAHGGTIFATAHSRGLRLNLYARLINLPFLCHSAFARVATITIKRLLEMAILCHSAFARVATAEKQCSALRICCEKVDSFSSVGESGLALTIFPFSFAAKATYVAINDSFGRAIDRFFGANRTGISVNYDFAEHPCL